MRMWRNIMWYRGRKTDGLCDLDSISVLLFVTHESVTMGRRAGSKCWPLKRSELGHFISYRIFTMLLLLYIQRYPDVDGNSSSMINKSRLMFGLITLSGTNCHQLTHRFQGQKVLDNYHPLHSISSSSSNLSHSSHIPNTSIHPSSPI